MNAKTKYMDLPLIKGFVTHITKRILANLIRNL